jgi:hypothetical protein
LSIELRDFYLIKKSVWKMTSLNWIIKLLVFLK